LEYQTEDWSFASSIFIEFAFVERAKDVILVFSFENVTMKRVNLSRHESRC